MTSRSYVRSDDLDWNPHPRFAGVMIKHMVTSQVAQAISTHLVKIEAGSEIPAHIHETQRETFYVIEGQGSLLMQGALRPWGPGDCATVPAGEEHGVRNESDKPLLFVATFTPALV